MRFQRPTVARTKTPTPGEASGRVPLTGDEHRSVNGSTLPTSSQVDSSMRGPSASSPGCTAPELEVTGYHRGSCCADA